MKVNTLTEHRLDFKTVVNRSSALQHAKKAMTTKKNNDIEVTREEPRNFQLWLIRDLDVNNFF